MDGNIEILNFIYQKFPPVFERISAGILIMGVICMGTSQNILCKIVRSCILGYC